MHPVTLPDGAYRSPAEIIRRERHATALRDADIGQAFLCYEQALPGANPYLFGYNTDPQARHHAQSGRRGAIAAEIARVFSSQLQVSVRRLVDRIMAELFPDGTEWADLQAGDDYDPETAHTPDDAAERETDRKGLNAMLRPMQKHVFQDLHRSNFSEEAIGALFDAVIWRVGLLKASHTKGEGPSAVTWEHVSQAECSFEWLPGGKLSAFYRQHYFTQEEAEYYWPDGGGWRFDGGGDDVAEEQQRRTFIETTYRVPRTKRWAYQVIQIHETNGQECVRRAFPRCPLVAFGVNGPPGGVLTRSVVEVALPTARSLNTMTRITLEAAEWRATPTFTASQGGVPNSANLRIRPGVVVPVKSNARGAPSLQRLDVGGDVEMGWQTEERLSGQVKEITYDEALPPDRPQPRTATEVLELVKRFRTTMGTPFNRLMNGLGIPVLQRQLDALYEEKEVQGMNRGKNKDGKDTFSVVELDGREVKVAFQNPLAQAQRIREVEDVVMSIETANSVMPPEMVAASIGLEELPAFQQEQLKLPKWYAKPKDDRQGLAQQATRTLVAGGGAAGGAGGPRAGATDPTSTFTAPVAP